MNLGHNAAVRGKSHVNRLYHASGGSRRSPERSEGSSLRLLRHDASIEHGAFLYLVPPQLGRYEVVEIVRDVTIRAAEKTFHPI